MRNVFLAFDLGASSGRAILGTLDNGLLSLNEVHRFPNGPIERDGSLFWDYPALCNEIKTGLRKALAAEPAIDSIALDTWGVDYALFDRTSRQLKRLPYHYRDHRTDHISDEVWNKISKNELYSCTGIQYMQLNTLYQLAAHQKEHPEDFDNAFLLPIPDALMFAFGAAPTAEYTMASTTNLLNPFSREWDFELIDVLGLPRDIFPAIVAPCTSAGFLDEKICRELDCQPIPICKIGSHDTASAVAAVPASSPDFAYISCGTWALLGAELTTPVITPETEKVPFTNEGGLDGKIRFLTNIMGSWLLQETRRHWNESGRNLSFADMEKMALAATPGKFRINPADPDFLAPGDMPARIKAHCEQNGQGTIPDDNTLLRTIYDSLALSFAEYFDQLEATLNRKLPHIHLVGGGTKDTLLMQLTANTSRRTVTAGPTEATAIGNLLGQAITTNTIPNLATARTIIRNSFTPTTYPPCPQS